MAGQGALEIGEVAVGTRGQEEAQYHFTARYLTDTEMRMTGDDKG